MIAERISGVWNGFFFRGFSGESLGVLRVLFGIGLFIFHFTQFDNVFRYDISGPHYYYLDPMWHFQLLGIQTHVPVVTLAAFVLLLLSTASMTLGRYTRSSILLVVLCIFYLKGARDSVAGDVHHRYLIPIQILFFLAISRCGDVLSWDALRRAKRGLRPVPLEEWEASWPIKAMQLYCVSFYFWGGVAKLRVTGWAWFADGERIQSLLMKRALIWGAGEDGVPLGNSLAYQLAQWPDLCMLLSLATELMELGFPLLLLVRNNRWRFILLAGVACFHLANLVLVYVGFALIPVVFLVFFDFAPWSQRLRSRWNCGAAV